MWTSYHNPQHEFEGSSFRTFLIYSLLVHLALLALFVWLRPQQAASGPMTVELREGVNLPSFGAPAPGAAANGGPAPQPVPAPAPVPVPSAPTASAPRFFPSPASSYSTGSPAGSASGSRGEGGYSFPASPFPSQQRKNDPLGAGFSTYSGSRQ